MTEEDGRELERRAVLQGMAGLGGIGLTALAGASDLPAADPTEIEQSMAGADPHTVDTFTAAVDAVVPATPELADEPGFGDADIPGGVAAGVHEYFITYVNTLFEWGLPGAGHLGNLRLAEAVAALLDAGAEELLLRGLNEHAPGPDYTPPGESWTAPGPFATLHPEDRIRALALFDEAEKEFDTATLPGPLAEMDAGIVGQLIVAFPEVIYYSEWQGYDDLSAPPSERRFDGDAVQSWAQTGFPGFADGYAAHRGYLAGQQHLGAGPVWRVTRGPGPTLRFTARSGDFEDNDDYQPQDWRDKVPHPISGEDDGDGTGDEEDRGETDSPDDGGLDVSIDVDLDIGGGD